MLEDDNLLIRDLQESFSLQLQRYVELRDWAGKLLGKLILSRGDMSVVVSGFDHKKRLLETIAEERTRMADKISAWQLRKAELERCAGAEELNAIFGKMEAVIKEFLEAEEQLRMYLEKIIRKESGS